MEIDSTTIIQKIADGRTDLVFDLLRDGGSASATDARGVSILKWCAFYGDVSAIKYLMQHGAELTELGNNYDLNGAVFHKHWQLAQYLIEQGADVNYVLEDTQESLLHQAVSSNQVVSEMITALLLHHGADPNTRTLENKESGSFMRDVRTRGETPLHRAAAFGSPKIIKLLLNANADKTARDMNGDSPMSWASWYKRKGEILFLLNTETHFIRQAHVDKMPTDNTYTREGLMSRNLLGDVHLDL